MKARKLIDSDSSQFALYESDTTPILAAAEIGSGVSSVTIDETAGLQNATETPTSGDADDNDTSLTLPIAFSDRIPALSAGTQVALSGYTGANTGTDAVAVTGTGTVTDIAFTDAFGEPLNGDSSGRFTVDGQEVFLWTDAVNNNIVLGTTSDDPNVVGDIVFAAYLDETATGAKMWMVQYEALDHPDETDHDDAINLTDKVHVTVDQASDFSLENAPSGQNLFMMFGTSAGAIVVTGRDPANQSEGEKVSTGDTVNTSQGGGGTTIGANNQMVDPNEGMYFTFVTGADPNYTVPLLDQGEAKLESKIAFTGLLGVDSAAFKISQLQSGKAATITISAFTTDSEPGNGFVDGLGDGDDLSVAISQVIVRDASGVIVENSDGSANDSTISINLAGDTAVVTGVKASYSIEYFTDGEHNRVLIENTGSGDNGASFDIGGFSLTEGTSTTTEIGSQMIFEDDGPSLGAVDGTSGLLVDESLLGTDDTEDFSDLFTPTYGADGQGSVGNYTLGVKAGAAPDSGIDDTATGQSIWLYMDGNDVVGRVGSGGAADANGAVAFRVSVNSGTGVVTLDQVRAVMHDIDGGPGLMPDKHDDATGLTGSDLITLSATVTDKDGDTNTATADITAAISFEDDGPSVVASVVGVHTLTTDDSDTPTSIDGPTTFSDLFTPDFGEDGSLDADHNGIADDNAVVYALALKNDGTDVDSGLTDTLTGVAVVMNKVDDYIVGTVDGSGEEVFRITLNTDTGAVTLTQSRSIVHDDPDDPVETGESAAVLSAADLVTLSATVTDGDGDTATATRDIGAAFKFEDDGPTVNSITHVYAFNTVALINGANDFSINGDRVGSDQYDGIVLTSFSGTTGTEGWAITPTSPLTWISEDGEVVTYTFSFNYQADPDPLNQSPSSGTLTFNKLTGTFDFDLNEPIAAYLTYSTSDPSESFNYNTLGNKSPEIVVQKYGEGFYGVLTGQAADPPSDTSDLKAGGDYVFGDDEQFSSVSTAYVNIATDTLGVNSDTIQHGELLNYDFYAENPVSGSTSPPAQPGATVDASTPRAYADSIAITLDQIIEGEDIVILLKLEDRVTHATTTKLLVADSAADYVTSGSYKVVTVDEDNYDNSQYQIYGVQVLSSTEEVDEGTGYRLSTDEEVGLGASGSNYADTADSDVMKIIKIDVTINAPADADLTFNGQLIDGDGDSADFSFNVHLEGDSAVLTGSAGNDYLNGTSGSDTIDGLGGDDILVGGGGIDFLSGGDGSDRFVLLAADGNVRDNIDNFVRGSGGDILDISDLLDGYEAGVSTLADFVSVDVGVNSAVISVDRDGASGPGVFQEIAILTNVDVVGLSVNSLLGDGNIDLVR